MLKLSCNFLQWARAQSRNSTKSAKWTGAYIRLSYKLCHSVHEEVLDPWLPVDCEVNWSFWLDAQGDLCLRWVHMSHFVHTGVYSGAVWSGSTLFALKEAMIWVCTVCQGLKNRTLGMNGLSLVWFQKDWCDIVLFPTVSSNFSLRNILSLF